MQQHIRVKVCGLTREEDIAFVNRWHPDYAGLVFANGRRKVSALQAKRLCGLLDAGIGRVGVFVNENPEAIHELAAELGLNVVQLHGDETPGELANLRRLCRKNGLDTEIWKAFRIRNEKDMDNLKYYEADAFVLDASIDGAYGGTGKAFDWALARDAGSRAKIILAGGLNSLNVAGAIKIVRPYAVDTSSGVETGGVKDEGKIRDFMAAVKNA